MPPGFQARAVRARELDDMVGILCEAFDLPFEPARDLVLADPYFDLTRKRVTVDGDGRIASCLTVVERQMRIGAAVVPVAGIAGVATRIDHRGRGSATELLRATLQFVRSEGIGLAALVAEDPRCYERAGFARAGKHVRVTVPANCVPRSRASGHVRPIVKADIPAISSLYRHHSQHHTGACLRDAVRWENLMQHMGSWAGYDCGGLDGYAVFDTSSQPGGPTTIGVAEICARTGAGRRSLLATLAAASPTGLISLCGPEWAIEESGLALRSAVIEDAPGPMFRVADLRTALSAWLPNASGFLGRLGLRMLDRSLHGGVFGSALLIGTARGVALEPLADGEPADIEGDEAAWASLLVGGMSLAEAVDAELVRLSSPDIVERAGPFFPQRGPAILALDYF